MKLLHESSQSWLLKFPNPELTFYHMDKGILINSKETWNINRSEILLLV